MFQENVSIGYRFTFDNMNLTDQSKDGVVYISADKATYDRQEGKVFLESPEIRSMNSDGEEQWRASGRHGTAEVQKPGNLFPSSLGDVRLASDVVIAQPAANRILSTSGVVSYLVGDQVLVSADRAYVRDLSRRSAMKGFLMGTIGERQMLIQGNSIEQMVDRYRKIRQIRENQEAEGGTTK